MAQGGASLKEGGSGRSRKVSEPSRGMHSSVDARLDGMSVDWRPMQ